MKTFIQLLAVLLLISSQTFSQTTYTWVGTTNTDWDTSTNWSPNGVPDTLSTVIIDSAANSPTLSSDVDVYKFTMDGGGFNLAGYTIEVERAIDINGGWISRGLIYARQLQPMSNDVFYVDDATLDCDIDVRTPRMSFENSVFNDTVKVEQYGGWVNNSGGNVFNDHVHIIQEVGAAVLGATGVDSLMSTYLLEIEPTAGYIWYSGTSGVYYGDDVIVRNSAGGRTLTTQGPATFNGDLYLGSATGTGGMNIGVSGESVTMTTGHSIKVDTMGLNGGGALKLQELTQSGTEEIDLSSIDGELWVTDCSIGGTLTTSSSEYTKLYGDNIFGEVVFGKLSTWAGAVFNGKADITCASSSTGGNVFHDTTNITISTAGLLMGYSGPDTALAPFTLSHNGTSDTYLNFNKTGSYFADKVTINNSSSRWLYMGYTTGATTTFEDDIELNQDDGIGIKFGGTSTTVNGGIYTGSTGISDGNLYFNTITQTTNDSIVLTGVDAGSSVQFTSGCDLTGHLRLEGGSPYMYQATFGGGASIASASVPPTYCHFGGDTYFTKTGGTNNLTKANYYAGDLTITNESTTNYIYMGYQVTDTVIGDLTLINNGNSLVWAASTTKLPLTGDLTLDGTGEIRLGYWGVGDYLAFEGSGNQSVSIGDSVTHTMYRMLIDKSSGSVILNDSLVVDDELKFTDGRIICQGDGMVTLRDGIAVTGVDDETYVEGPVKKVGNDAFDFPIGRNGLYRTISIAAPSATTDEFVAEYFEFSSDSEYDHDSKDSTLNNISSNEFWSLERLIGTSTPTLTLAWDSVTSCDIDSPLTGLHVAGWSNTGSEWKDLGNGGTTGTLSEGTIASSNTVTEFTAFTLAADSSLVCVDCNSGLLVQSDSCLTSTVTEGGNWFRFEADSTVMTVIISGNEEEYPFADSVAVFESCHHSNSVGEAAYDSDSLSSVLLLTLDSLVYGHTYWVKCIKTDTNTISGSICVMRGGGSSVITVPAIPCERVPNGRFEGTLGAPPCGTLAIGGFPIVTDWFASQWTPDIYNAACDCPNIGVNNGGGAIGIGVHGTGPSGGGIAPDATDGGSTYAGVNTFNNNVTDQREYMGNLFDQPLVAGTCYRLSMLVALRDVNNGCPGSAWTGCGNARATFEVNSFGAFITNTALTYTGLQTIPNNGPGCNGTGLYHIADPADANTVIDDGTQWEERVVYFTAAGGEDRIYLGNFCTDAEAATASGGPPSVISGFESCTNGPRARVLYDNVSVLDIAYLGSDMKPCIGDLTVLGCEDLSAEGVTYEWTSDQTGTTVLSTNATYEVSPTVETVYTLTITLPDLSECSNTITLAPRQCCAEDVYHVAGDVDVDDLITQGVVNATSFEITTDVVFEGIVTLDQDVRFQGLDINTPVNVWFYPDARIDVEANTTMESEYAVYDAACEEIWNRIRIDESTSAIDMTESIVRNSERGLVMRNGCDVTLTDNVFEFNASHMRFVNGNYSTADITGNVLRCSDDAGTNINPNAYWGGNPGILPNTLNLSNTQLRTDWSVYIDNSNVRFGLTNEPLNIIRDGHHGITGIDYGLTCTRTTFIDINEDDTFIGGLDLQVYDTPSFCIRRTETPGEFPNNDFLLVSDCFFLDSDNGIFGQNLGRSVEIDGNIFHTIASPRTEEASNTDCGANDPRSVGTGLWFQNCDIDAIGNCRAVAYQILDNWFIDVSHGIRVDDLANGVLEINENIMLWNDLETSDLLLRGEGIRIDNPIANENLNVGIKGNRLIDCWRGIHMRHVNGSDPSYDVGTDVFVYDNDISLFQPTFFEDPITYDLCWAPYAGIWLETAVNVTVAKNNIHGPSNYDFTGDFSADGIRTFNTHLTDYYCNDLHRLGNGFHLIAANDASQMVTTEMWDNRVGFLYNEAITGDQGNTTECNGNSWTGGNWPVTQTDLAPFHIGVFSPTETWNGVNNEFFHSNSSPNFFPDNLDNNLGFLPPPTLFNNITINNAGSVGGIAQDVCDGLPYPQLGLSVAERDTIYLSLLTDSIPSGRQDSTLYWETYYGLYAVLLNDTAVTNVDTVLDNLKDSLHTSSVGIVYRTLEALGDSTLDSTLLTNYNDTLGKETTSFDAESLLVEHLEKYTDIIANEDTLVADDISDLMDLAEGCPMTSGMVVIMARSLLASVDSLSHREWLNECELLSDTTGGSSRLSGSSEQQESNYSEMKDAGKIQVFPNPTEGVLSIILPNKPDNVWTCSIANIAGVEMGSRKLYGQKQKIDFGKVPSGLYYLTIEDNEGKQRFAEKFVIIR